MAGGQIGKLSVRVLPDTRSFRKDLQTALGRIERTVSASIQVHAVLDRSALADVKARLRDLDATARVGVDESDLDGLKDRVKQAMPSKLSVPATVDQQSIKAMRARLQKSLQDAEARIPATVDGERLRRQLRETVARAEQSLDVDIPMGVEGAAAWRAKIAAIVAEAERQSVDIPVRPDVKHAAWAQALLSLQVLEKVREIPVRLNTRGLNRGIANLSGLSAMTRLSGEFLDTIRNLDQSMPRLARAATILGTVTAGTLAGVSNLLGIAQGLAAIGPLMLVAPAAMAGAVVSMLIVKRAMADASQYVGDLKGKYDALGQSLSSAFWSTAESGVRRFTKAILPLASRHLPALASSLGAWSGAIAGAFEAPRGAANLTAFFKNTTAMIRNMRDGLGFLTGGILELVGAGSKFLPRLGAAFTDVARDFRSWITAAVDSGRFFAWVETAIVNFKALGGVLAGVWGILSALTTAATSAGAAGLPQLAAGLAGVSAALNGPAWQGALTTVFAGAHKAMGNLVPGVRALGDAFIAIAPFLAQIMDLATQIASVALVELAKAVQNPVLQQGLLDLFRGALEGLKLFAPAIPVLAEKIGHIAELAGTMARVFGEVLGGALIAFSPVISAITDALGVLVPVLGGALLAAVQAVAPFIVAVVTAVSAWVQANPQLAATLAVAVGVLGAFMAGLAGLVGFLVPVVTGIAGLIAALAPFAPTILGVVGGLGSLLATVLPVAAGIAALAAALVIAWQNSAVFRDGITSLFEGLAAVVRPIVDLFTQYVLPAVMQVVGAFLGMVVQIATALAPLVGVVAGIFGPILGLLGSFLSFVVEQLGPIFPWLGGIVSSAFGLIGAVIQTALDLITGTLSVFAELLKGNWAGAWDAVKAYSDRIWEDLKANFRAALDVLSSIIGVGVDDIVRFFSELPGKIAGGLGDLGNLLTGHGRAIIDGFTGGLRDAWERGKDFVGGIAGWIRDNKGPLSYDRTLLVPAGRAIMGGFNKALQRGLSAVRSTVLGIAPMIERAISGVSANASVDLGMEAEVKAAQAAMARMSPDAGMVQRYVIDSAEAGESERAYVADKTVDALRNLKVELDTGLLVGGLVYSRQGQNAFGGV